MSSDDEPDVPDYSDNKHVDELTMKLLSNKTNYAKYLSMTDERKHEAREQFMKDCIDHKSNILSMTRNMCNGKDNEYGSDVTESFEKYAQTLIRYLEVKESSDKAQREYEDTNDTSDEDVMFPSSIDEKRTKPKYKRNPFTLDHFIRK
jgi:hypothetical protein